MDHQARRLLLPSPLGPFVKGPNNGRVLHGGAHWAGPGHNAVIRGTDGALHTFFHAYRLAEGTPKCTAAPGAKDNNQRHLLEARVVFKDGWPRIVSGM